MNRLYNQKDVFLCFVILCFFYLRCKDMNLFFMLIYFFVKINTKNKNNYNFNRMSVGDFVCWWVILTKNLLFY